MKALRIIYIVAIIFFLFNNPLLKAQGWQQAYPEFGVNTPSSNISYTSKNILPQTNGNFIVLIANGFNSQLVEEYYIIEVDDQGNKLRQKALGVNGAGNDARVLLQMANGNFAIASNIGTLPGGNYVEPSIHISILDVNFNLVTENIIPPSLDYIGVTEFIEIPGGGFWMFGFGNFATGSSFLRKLDATGNLVGNQITDQLGSVIGRQLIPESGGGVSVLSYERINGGFDYSTLINEYDSNGNFVSQLIFDHNNGQLIPVEMDRTSDGGFILAGRNIDNKSVLLKLDQNKIEEWRKEFDPPNFLAFVGIKSLPNSQGYRISFYEQNSPISNSGLIETDINGNWVYKKSYYQNIHNSPQELILLPDGGTLLSGYRDLNASIYFSSGNIPYLIRTDALGFTFDSGVSGLVETDMDADCIADNLDNIPGRIVGAYDNGFLVNSATVDSAGDYLLSISPGDYKLAVRLPNDLWSSCQDSVDITVSASDTLEDLDFVLAYNPEPLDSIFGYVFEDYDGDCIQDSFETIGHAGWVVNLEISEDGVSTTYLDTTDINGYYSFTDFMGATNAAGAFLFFEQPIGTGLNCAYSCWQELNLDLIPNTAINFNNGVTCDTLPFCPIMHVSMGTNQIRPCIDGNYQVYYQNIGGDTANDAYLEVTIDSALTIIDASIPWTSQQGNLLTFDVGDLLSNQSGSIQINFETPCNDPAGTTYCSSVHAYPDSTCVPPGTNWDGSEIELMGECLGDSIKFTITNVGTGNMSSMLDYVIIEDNVLLFAQPGEFILEAGEFMEVTLENNADFYRMIAMQPEGFPGLATPISWVEGCGTADPTMGFTNQYPLGDEDPWLDILCLESVNSYDPNDKQGFPRGVDEENYIDQNEPIEYHIRFQNTGTAEALYVEIRDTLATQWLDPTTLRPGASSHHYTWDIEGNGIVVFKFLNINLPDSTSNPEGSNGFVTFKIQQRSDNPIGTEIRNTAAIYFDNNPPIITNETLHTIGEEYLIFVKTYSPTEVFANNIQLNPNPATDIVQIDLEDMIVEEELSISIYDIFGRVMLSRTFGEKGSYMLDVKSVTSGTYFYRIFDGKQVIGTGKLVKI